jgi:predicted helicase
LPEFNKDELRGIKSFPQLIKYLRDELDWPIEADDFEDSTFDYDPEELGIDPKTAAKIQEIKQLRPLVSNQPWGVFFVKFEPKKLPVVVLRRILSKLAIKKRTSAVKSEQAVWNLHDLLFISNYGEGDHRQMTFANFSQDENNADLPTLKVLGWDYEDTELHVDNVHHELKAKLRWPADEKNIQKWRESWSSAFILRNQQVITTSKDLATRLAALAQRIRERAKRVLELENATGAMRQLYRAFQETLIHDIKEDDFADMYAQTIAYGLLAARMSRPMGITSSNVADMVPNTNPFLRDILGTFITTGGRQGKINFDELGVQEIVELLNSPETHMEAILRDFGNRTRQEDPIIHFYELFLTEYDKKKKVERGVFYTPQPVVSYIVRSIHELLKKDFGLEDGLADITTWGEITERNKNIKIPDGIQPNEPFVQILDPAVGTATFLVEVIDVIHKTMTTKWLNLGHMALEFPQLWNEYVPKHLLPRIYGYELMMAPYAIAHMRLGLKLFETGYRFGQDTPRANIYLTNSLEPAGEVGPHRKFEQLAPALAHEAKAVNDIKWNKRFTVVIGNPPYSVSSQNKSSFIEGLMELYKIDVRSEPNIKPLSDDYVKFFRFGHHQICETSVGIIGLITNNSFLWGPTFLGMRRKLAANFPFIYILNLHGDSLSGETSPAGIKDENIFDIRQGVTTSICCKPTNKQSTSAVVFSFDMYGTREIKYDLLDGQSCTSIAWQKLNDTESGVFISVDDTYGDEYRKFPIITEIFTKHSKPILTKRDNITIHFDKVSLLETIHDLIQLTHQEFVERYSLEADSRDWKYSAARQTIQSFGIKEEFLLQINYRPFDRRWTYYVNKTKGFMAYPVYGLLSHMLQPNLALCLPRQINQVPWRHVLVSSGLVEFCYISNQTREANDVFPLYSYNDERTLLEITNSRQSNLSIVFLRNLSKKLQLELSNLSGLPNGLTPENIFGYTYSIFQCPGYRKRYAQFLKRDFPRLPLTSSLELFQALSSLGTELVALHLMQSPKLNTLITRWNGPTPSCVVEKISYSDRTVWINKEQSSGFCGVPENVWNFHIGGYQVSDKWLKDRKGRVLSAEDINHYQKIVVALNETIRLMKEIDEVIDKHGGWPGAFQ